MATTCNGTVAGKDGATARMTPRTVLEPRIAGATHASDKSTAVSTQNAAATAANKTRNLSVAPCCVTAKAATPAPMVAMTRMDVHVAHRRTGRSVSRLGRSRNRPTPATTAPDTGPSTTAAKTQTSEAIVT